MKTKIILLAIFLCILTNSIHGQDEKRKFLFLETGIDGIGCSTPDKDYIRAVSDPSTSQYYSDKIIALMMLESIGLKFEYRTVSNKFGFSGGLQYTRMITSIGRDSYMSSAPDYFYVHYDPNSINTEYAKVRELNQKVDYLGIPLELRIYPYKDRKVNFYYKAGVSFNLKINSKSDIVFYNDFMEMYRNNVIKVVEKAAPYYTTFNLGLGLKVGKSEKPGFSIEVNAPIEVIFPDKSYFVKPQAGGGFQIMARIPINNPKNEK
jgi:hypothetical protein